MSIELFILVFITLVVLSTYMTSIINVEFNINELLDILDMKIDQHQRYFRIVPKKK